MNWLSRSACGLAALSMFVGSVASADALRVDLSGETMRVDGALREWKGARFANLGTDDDASLRFALASQGDGLYLAAEVHDDQLVRKAAPGPGQDALVLALFAKGSDGPARAIEVFLHAGRVGREKASAGLRASGKGVTPASEIKVVEGPLAEGKGYVIEAFIPWKSVASNETWEQARASLRYEDVDRAGGGVETTLSTSSESKPEAWPALTLGAGQLDLYATFLKAQNLVGVTPRFDARADVAGDALEERVVIVDKYVLVYGKHFKDGQSYSFYALPYSVGGGLVGAELIDLTDDGHAELVARVRQQNALGARVLATVLSLGEEQIAPIFALELKKETKGGFIENELHIDKKARPKQLVLSQARAQGLTPETYREDPATDAAPILLPWGSLEAQSYAYRDGKFVCVAQRESKSARAAAKADGAATASAAPAVAPEQQATGDATADLLLGRGAGGAALRFKHEANLTGSAARELVFVQGRRIIVSGPDLGPAGSYLAYGLPVQSEDAIISVSSAELSGEGKAVLLARYRQSTPDGVGHELLALLAVEAGAQGRGFRPLMVAELVRRQGDKAIVNQVQVAKGVLTIAPGKAEGYTRETYPFNNEAMPGIERLLLPWADSPRRYRLEAGRLRAE